MPTRHRVHHARLPSSTPRPPAGPSAVPVPQQCAGGTALVPYPQRANRLSVHMPKSALLSPHLPRSALPTPAKQHSPHTPAKQRRGNDSVEAALERGHRQDDLHDVAKCGVQQATDHVAKPGEEAGAAGGRASASRAGRRAGSGLASEQDERCDGV
eukprot:115692-Chlamydomonas_euryale.AAC.8